MIHEITCGAAQAVQIGDEVEIAIIAIEGGGVRLGITAPEGRRLLRIDPIPLPPGAADMRLMGLERAPNWPRTAPGRKE